MNTSPEPAFSESESDASTTATLGPKFVSRRNVLLLASTAGMSALAIGPGIAATTKTTKKATAKTAKKTTKSTAGASPSGSCLETPQETNGPFPGDGTNGPNVLSTDKVVRSDIRSSFGTAGKAVATGVPLTVKLQIKSTKTCAAMPGVAVYIWHCDAQGRYSIYDSTLTNENYLRGVQGADANGFVTFQTVFPGAYRGRWPHIHFAVYPSLAKATSGNNAIATSQIAFPDSICNTVYATNGYPASASNMRGLSLATDGVFRDDGGIHELATMTGSLTTGLVATLVVNVNPDATPGG